ESRRFTKKHKQNPGETRGRFLMPHHPNICLKLTSEQADIKLEHFLEYFLERRSVMIMTETQIIQRKTLI
ncbi:hypothetical protein, partial [uncultured Faecalibaculum sp.]|uniref:hypothetical protein n=1 Tax=uncultured Faecalibaculum sp. TaxID=1729681 RepID=UPI0025D2799C